MAFLIHYNHNHDPRNGRFTFGSGPRVTIRKANRIDAIANEHTVKQRKFEDRYRKNSNRANRSRNTKLQATYYKRAAKNKNKADYHEEIANVKKRQASGMINDLQKRGYDISINDDAFKRKRALPRDEFSVLEGHGVKAYKEYKKMKKNVKRYKF